MATIKERADKYSASTPYSDKYPSWEGYVKGATDQQTIMRPELKAIERDKNGFATEKCKAEMYEALPIIIIVTSQVSSYSTTEYYNKESWDFVVGEIERKTSYTHYFKCPQLD